LRPALRKISAYDSSNYHLRTGKKERANKKKIVWKNENNNIGGEESIRDSSSLDDPVNETTADETQSLVRTPEVKITINEAKEGMHHLRPLKPRTGVIRRLTLKEKQELYEVRPDLQIVPNWAQKYREEMSGSADVAKCNNCLFLLIIFLLLLLVFLFYMITRTKPETET
jgi:hypothetical protein